MNNDTTSRITKARAETIVFAVGIEIETYQLPSGEVRYSKTGASTLLGRDRTWLSTVTRREGKALKGLQAEGYSCRQLPVVIENRNSRGGVTTADTISRDDLLALIAFDSARGNKKAQALSTALNREALARREAEVHGLRGETLEERQESFRETYERSLSESEEELMDQWLPGDFEAYPQFAFGYQSKF